MRRALVRTRWSQGALSNYKKSAEEPDDHAIGRSRGGLTTKIHQAVDGRGRPLAMVITGGQRNDGAMLAHVLAEIHVPGSAADDPERDPTRSSPTGLTRQG